MRNKKKQERYTLDYDAFLKIDEILSEELISLLGPIFSEIDANWYSCRLYLGKDEASLEEKKVKISLSDHSFKVVFNGPAQGETKVDLSKYPHCLSGFNALRALGALLFKLKGSEVHFWLKNPNYKWEYVPKRTVVVFEHCAEGVIQGYNHKKGTFRIKMRQKQFNKKSFPTLEYTVEQLFEEMEAQRDSEACYLQYLSPQKKKKK